MSSNGFAVDTPFTDLDTDRDFENFEVDNHNYDQDNISIDLNALDFGYKPNAFTRTIRSLSSFFTKRKRLDEFDLDNFDANEEFNLDDDFILSSFKRGKGRNRTIWGISGGIFTKGALITIIGLLIALVVLIAGKNSHSDSNDPPNKFIYNNGTYDYYNTTILISLDGFHPHYISYETTPFLAKLYENEAYISPFMNPSNPSVTFTNHWTLVTGLNPLDHGIVGNKFFSPVFNETFNRELKESYDPKWWGGEPIWSTARKQGLSVATHMWPGSEVIFGDDLDPNYVDPFNKEEDLNDKFGRIVQLLEYPIEKRPQLILSYIPLIDTIGHLEGIAGDKLKRGLNIVDKFIDNFCTYLENENLSQFTNVVIVSDHGMSPTSSERVIYLDDLVELNDIEYIDGWPLYGLRPFENINVDQLFKNIQSKWESHNLNTHFEVFQRDQIINKLFGGSTSQFIDRVAPIWIIPKIGYVITTKDDMAKFKGKYQPMGVHGYDSSEVLMRSLFMATGPYFEKKLGNEHKVQPFNNVEIYNIICDTLNLKPSDNNGTTTSVINKAHVLDSEWNDIYVYPNVSFEIDILQEKSVYNQLFILENENQDGGLKDEQQEADEEDEDDQKNGNQNEENQSEESTNEYDDDQQNGTEDVDSDKNNVEDNYDNNNDQKLNQSEETKQDSESNSLDEPSTGDPAENSDAETETETETETNTTDTENMEAEVTAPDSKEETHKGKSWWSIFHKVAEEVEDFVDEKVEDIEEYIDDHRHSGD